MGWRYRKSIKIAPGVKVNLGKKGVSLTLGQKGVHTTINTRGEVTNSFGIPGTGLSYRKTVKPFKNASTSSSSNLSAKANSEFARLNLASSIKSIKESKVMKIDWRRIAMSDINSSSSDSFKWLKNISYRVLSGDIQSYCDVVSYMNNYSAFNGIENAIEYSVQDRNTVCVNFNIECNLLSGIAKNDRLLLDYVCSIALRLGKIFFGLLPVENAIVDAIFGDKAVLSAIFTREALESADLSTSDSSFFISLFRSRMSWRDDIGFSPIEVFDSCPF